MGYGGLGRVIVDEALEYTGPHIIAVVQVELGQVQTGGDSSVWSSLDMRPGFQDTSNSLHSNFRLDSRFKMPPQMKPVGGRYVFR